MPRTLTRGPGQHHIEITVEDEEFDPAPEDQGIRKYFDVWAPGWRRATKINGRNYLVRVKPR